MIYVHPYFDSENQDDCLVLYNVTLLKNNNPIVSYLGNMNLKQRFFIKGDKSLLNVYEYDDNHITLLDNAICYPIEEYAKKSMYSTIVADVMSLVQPTSNAPYRFSPTFHAPKIVFF
jgi:hypothetical protein